MSLFELLAEKYMTCLWAGSEVMLFLLTSLRRVMFSLIIQQITFDVALLWHNRCLLAGC